MLLTVTTKLTVLPAWACVGSQIFAISSLPSLTSIGHVLSALALPAAERARTVFV